LAGAISGAVSGAIGQTRGGGAQVTAFNIMANTSVQVATTLANGGTLTPGLIAGSIAGGLVGNGAPDYTGVGGSVGNNMLAELLYNMEKYSVMGAVSGAVQMGIDHHNSEAGVVPGAVNGLLGGAITTGTTLAVWGPSYIPTGKFVSFGGVYRRGGLSRIAGAGTGITIGRNMVTHLHKGEGWIQSNYFADYHSVSIATENSMIVAHESFHYWQQLSLGFGSFYGRTATDYWDWTFHGVNPYLTPGTFEYMSDSYARAFVLNIFDP
ncbi:MAG TPA: hypothetical protein PK760_10720, partial [Flavobacteriales bacterium]|nr:hypothetical protein [Flavobacteriales bacterium]